MEEEKLTVFEKICRVIIFAIFSLCCVIALIAMSPILIIYLIIEIPIYLFKNKEEKTNEIIDREKK